MEQVTKQGWLGELLPRPDDGGLNHANAGGQRGWKDRNGQQMHRCRVVLAYCRTVRRIVRPTTGALVLGRLGWTLLG